jgi:hypothetical protein
MEPDENPEWGLGSGLPKADAGSGDEPQTKGQPAAVSGAEGMHVGSAAALQECTMGEGSRASAQLPVGLPDVAVPLPDAIHLAFREFLESLTRTEPPVLTDFELSVPYEDEDGSYRMEACIVYRRLVPVVLPDVEPR